MSRAVMRRWTRRILAGISVLLLAAGLAGYWYQARATRRDLAAYPPPGKLVDVGGYRLHIWCTGSGGPAVILESGLGGTAFDWGHVQPAVAEFTQVCSYDRAGMGYSDGSPYPRTSQQVVSDLAALLDASAIRGPWCSLGRRPVAGTCGCSPAFTRHRFPDWFWSTPDTSATVNDWQLPEYQRIHLGWRG